jgi:hypothetical protein
VAEIIRTRDCIIFVKGDSVPVTVSDAMVTGGWPGGQGVAWVDSLVDEFKVTYSDGAWGGFLIWGSNEASDQFTGMTGQFAYYRYGQMLFGGNLMSTSSYEKYTYASRQIPPLVPLVYAAQDKLYFSLRGLWTKEDEWTITADPRAPNTNVAGVVVQVPKQLNNFFLTIQTIL